MKKRLLSLLVVVVMIAQLFLTLMYSVNAEPEVKYFEVPFFLGYVANDRGEITAEDARAVLMCSAGLAGFDDFNVYNAEISADADFDGSITAKDARIILRVSAKLDLFDINIKLGEGVKIGHIENFGNSHIDFETDSEDLKVERLVEWYTDYAPDDIFAPRRDTFFVTASKPGVYTFKLVRFGFVDEPRNTNVYRITVT